MEYKRGFAYSVATRTLEQFTDYLTGAVYERA